MDFKDNRRSALIGWCVLAGLCWEKAALVGGTNWHLVPNAFYANRLLKSALVSRCVLSISLTVVKIRYLEHAGM